MTQETKKTAGEITLQAGRKFCWMLSGEKKSEVYGFIQRADGQAVDKTSGWWRTDDPEKAAQIAAATFPVTNERRFHLRGWTEDGLCWLTAAGWEDEPCEPKLYTELQCAKIIEKQRATNNDVRNEIYISIRMFLASPRVSAVK